MDDFKEYSGVLHAEQVPLPVIAERFGTPCYVYSRAALERQWHAFDDAFAGHPHLICFAVKANANLAVLNLLARLGSGFDIVSGGELARVLAAGGEPSKIVFSGVGKRTDELCTALTAGILCFNIESFSELQRLNQLAGKLNRTAPVALRINPDIDAQTHPYISTGLRENKFGIGMQDAEQIYLQRFDFKNLKFIGIACHIGSQLLDFNPFRAALTKILDLAQRLTQHGIVLNYLDLGGGLGIRYHQEQPPDPSEYVTAIREQLTDFNYKIILEPGRAIVGNAGILLTRVEYLKYTEERNFAILDAAMNDLIRPALYQAYQAISPVIPNQNITPVCYDLVGPICETSDFLGKTRTLTLREGDLLAIRGCGAYGFTMSSNYNSRPRAAEILVDSQALYLIRERETFATLFAGERMLPDNIFIK